MNRYRFLVLNSVLLLALGGVAWGQHTARADAPKTDFLRPLSLPFQGWKTEDREPTPAELELLQPDATLIRLYSAPSGEFAELAVIAGHRKRSVHTPGYCMVGGGWDVLVQQPGTLAVGGKSIPTSTMLMRKDGQESLVTYFFTDGEFCTGSLPQYQWKQFQRRIGGGLPLGALVRIIVPVGRDRAGAEQFTAEFADAVVPQVLDSIRDARTP